DDSPRMKEIRSKYEAHVNAVFKLAGIEDGASKAARILALETKIAKVHASREESVDVRKANNPWRRTELGSRAPGLDWGQYLRAAGLDKAPSFIIWHPAATKGLAALVASEPLDVWKDWLTFHDLDTRSGVLTPAFDAEYFAFYVKVLTGVVQNPD